MLLDAIRLLGAWSWIIAGLVLAGLELLAPGVFFIWLGLAALVTGALDGALGLSWQAAFLVFAGLSVAAVLVGRRLTRGQGEPHAQQPFLNRRGEALLGQTYTLQAPVIGGEGQLRVGDSVWRVNGPDSDAGTRVRVLRIDGATLVVEPAGERA